MDPTKPMVWKRESGISSSTMEMLVSLLAFFWGGVRWSIGGLGFVERDAWDFIK